MTITSLFKVAAAAALCVASIAASAQTIKLWHLSSGLLELDKGWLTAMSGVGKIGRAHV